MNISPHLHVLVLDGVFANEEEGPRFVECPAPTNRDLLSLAQRVFKKMEKFLAKSGYLRSCLWVSVPCAASGPRSKAASVCSGT
ncbi:MAG: hypothetical protein IPK13_21655 [Deltaproteobacteria bacterium]|nr:hypothetical protein [Deltaproteobacteria bacterium]MBK8013941.1 hypothetical protein [Deltaproteobacteria bacterium]